MNKKARLFPLFTTLFIETGVKECDAKGSEWWLWNNREHFGLQITHLTSSDTFTLLNHFSM